MAITVNVTLDEDALREAICKAVAEARDAFECACHRAPKHDHVHVNIEHLNTHLPSEAGRDEYDLLRYYGINADWAYKYR